MNEKRKDYMNIDEIIRDTALAVQQSAKSENSSLLSDLRREVGIMKEHHKSIDEKLDLLIEQTTKTNGSVISLRLWKSWVAGGVGVLTMIVIPLICYIFFSSIKIIESDISIQANKINEVVDQINIMATGQQVIKTKLEQHMLK